MYLNSEFLKRRMLASTTPRALWSPTNVLEWYMSHTRLSKVFANSVPLSVLSLSGAPSSSTMSLKASLTPSTSLLGNALAWSLRENTSTAMRSQVIFLRFRREGYRWRSIRSACQRSFRKICGNEAGGLSLTGGLMQLFSPLLS
eukprot:Lithocolla_globosa_v1_NODE_7484_length_941_cov_12.996614.p2 type:complete len:144 gc:universal NODE_7484_length_941_cov_12.996614:434-3(-)